MALAGSKNVVPYFQCLFLFTDGVTDRHGKKRRFDRKFLLLLQQRHKNAILSFLIHFHAVNVLVN